jgi:predicted secreted hydrolase
MSNARTRVRRGALLAIAALPVFLMSTGRSHSADARAIGLPAAGVEAVGVQAAGVLATSVQPAGALADRVQAAGTLALGAQAADAEAVGVQAAGAGALGAQAAGAQADRVQAAGALALGAQAADAEAVGVQAAGALAAGAWTAGAQEAGAQTPSASVAREGAEAGRGPAGGQGWKIAEVGRGVLLPGDHVSHPDYKIEWWYYTGNLDTAEGRRFGYQLTFFRVGVNREPVGGSRWAVRDLHMAHFAVSDLGAGRFHVFDRLQREGAGWAGAATDRYRVWNGQWSAGAEADGAHRLQARDGGVGVDLRLTNTTYWVGHGDAGYSRKGREAANASEYYSLPRLATTGTLTVDGHVYEVTGASWMDHEFGSSVLEADQVGWDWFGLQLADGRDLMLYQMRRRDGTRDPFSSGTLAWPDGRVVRLTRDDYTLEPRGTWRSPTTGAVYPIRWHVTIPGQQLAVDVQAAMPDQELHTPRSTGVTYWEGAVDVTGTGPPTTRGRGYMELTGYNGVPLSDALR